MAIQPMESPPWGAQQIYGNPTGYMQHRAWLGTLPELGIPQSWGTYTGGIEEYLKAQQSQAQTGLLSGQLQALLDEQENKIAQMELEQRNRIAQMEEQYKLQQQGQEAMWGRLAPLLQQLGMSGMGGGGGGGMTPLSTALSASELNPLYLSGEEARRRIYAGGGSKRYRQTQLGTSTGGTQSAIAQAISGGRAAATTGAVDLQKQLITLLGQLSGQLS